MNQVPQDIYDTLLELEGGYKLHKVEHDAGGWTYAGITLRWHHHLRIWDDRDRLTCNPDNDIKTAIREFYDKLWNKMWLNQVTDKNKAAAVFIFGVHGGTGWAIYFAQQVCYPNKPKEWDKLVGTRTIRGINRMETNEFLDAFYKKCEMRYDEIVIKKPTQRKFRNGWQRRINEVDREYNNGRMAPQRLV